MRAAATIMSFVVAVMLVASEKQASKSDARWQAPASAMHQTNPLANDRARAAGGAKLFRAHCAQCHGQQGRGRENAPDLTAFDVQVQTDGTLFWKISNGNLDRGMPSFAGLPRMQRWQLVLHLRQLAQ